MKANLKVIKEGVNLIFQHNIITGKTIDDVWRDSMCVVLEMVILIQEQGSYKGQLRKQLDYVVIIVEQPGSKPLAVKYQKH